MFLHSCKYDVRSIETKLFSLEIELGQSIEQLDDQVSIIEIDEYDLRGPQIFSDKSNRISEFDLVPADQSIGNIPIRLLVLDDEIVEIQYCYEGTFGKLAENVSIENDLLRVHFSDVEIANYPFEATKNLKEGQCKISLVTDGVDYTSFLYIGFIN